MYIVGLVKTLDVTCSTIYSTKETIQVLFILRVTVFLRLDVSLYPH